MCEYPNRFFIGEAKNVVNTSSKGYSAENGSRSC